MVTLASIIPSLYPMDWFSALDLQDACFHVAIHHLHKKCFRFQVLGDRHQFQAFPFRLSTALQVFTKCLLLVTTHLHHWGIYVYLSLDLSSSNQGGSTQQISDSVSSNLHLFLNLVLKFNLSPYNSLAYIPASGEVPEFISHIYFQAWDWSQVLISHPLPDWGWDLFSPGSGQFTIQTSTEWSSLHWWLEPSNVCCGCLWLQYFPFRC